MKSGRTTFLTALLLIVLSLPALAQTGTRGPLPVQSRSGQFSVRALEPVAPLPNSFALGATNWVRLEPPFLAVTCERVKETILRQLSAPDRWRSRISITIHPVRLATDPILISPVRFADGWRYQVDLPDAVDPARLVRAITGLVLEEWADRASEKRSDVPRWLVEGLTETLLADETAELVVRPPDAKAGLVPVRRSARLATRGNPLAAARECLRTNATLTLELLTYPTPDLLAGPGLQTYRHCSQVMVQELLRLRDGRASLAAMLDGLGGAPNWQTVFYRAFAVQFPKPLDFEKWWELEIAHFTSRELTLQWDGRESLLQLQEVLRVNLRRPAQDGRPARHEALNLQTVLRREPFADQREVIALKTRQLGELRHRTVKDVAALAESYAKALDTYARRVESGLKETGGAHLNTYGMKRLAEGTAKRLDSLDQRVNELRARMARGAAGGK